MFRTSSSRWAALIAANVLFWYVLSFYQPAAEAQQSDHQPFANSVEQRFETINQLKELNAQIKEQNALLRSGKLRVVISLPDKI